MTPSILNKLSIYKFSFLMVSLFISHYDQSIEVCPVHFVLVVSLCIYSVLLDPTMNRAAHSSLSVLYSFQLAYSLTFSTTNTSAPQVPWLTSGSRNTSPHAPPCSRTHRRLCGLRQQICYTH